MELLLLLWVKWRRRRGVCYHCVDIPQCLRQKEVNKKCSKWKDRKRYRQLKGLFEWLPSFYSKDSCSFFFKISVFPLVRWVLSSGWASVGSTFFPSDSHRSASLWSHKLLPRHGFWHYPAWPTGFPLDFKGIMPASQPGCLHGFSSVVTRRDKGPEKCFSLRGDSSAPTGILVPHGQTLKLNVAAVYHRKSLRCHRMIKIDSFLLLFHTSPKSLLIGLQARESHCIREQFLLPKMLCS